MNTNPREPEQPRTYRLKLGKAEKLRHKTLVDRLFAQGQAAYAYPLRMVWRTLDQETLDASFRCEVPQGIARLQMLVTIPKRKRRHAVDRVLMRRRVRECYRLGRAPLRAWLDAHPECRSLQMAFVYMADKNVDSKTISRKMELLFKKMLDSLQPAAQDSDTEAEPGSQL